MKCEKTKYSDGISYCIWKPFKKDGSEEDEDCGICFDISEEDIDEAIKLLQEYRHKEPVIYKPDPEEEEFEKKWKEKTSTWYYKFWDTYLRNISITINFFDWNFRRSFFTSRRIIPKEKEEYMHQLCTGFAFGPFIITWR